MKIGTKYEWMSMMLKYSWEVFWRSSDECEIRKQNTWIFFLPSALIFFKLTLPSQIHVYKFIHATVSLLPREREREKRGKDDMKYGIYMGGKKCWLVSILVCGRYYVISMIHYFHSLTFVPSPHSSSRPDLLGTSV